MQSSPYDWTSQYSREVKTIFFSSTERIALRKHHPLHTLVSRNMTISALYSSNRLCTLYSCAEEKCSLCEQIQFHRFILFIFIVFMCVFFCLLYCCSITSFAAFCLYAMWCHSHLQHNAYRVTRKVQSLYRSA